MENSVIKIILNDLSKEKEKQEFLLQELLNTPLTSTLHTECIGVLMEITLINQTVETLKNYII